MARPGPETLVVKKIVKALDALPGTLVHKRHGSQFGVAGLADLSGCHDGIHVEIEVKKDQKTARPKRDGGGLSLLQEKMLYRYQEAGARCGVAWDVESALAIVEGRTKFEEGYNVER